MFCLGVVILKYSISKLYILKQYLWNVPFSGDTLSTSPPCTRPAPTSPPPLLRQTLEVSEAVPVVPEDGIPGGDRASRIRCRASQSLCQRKFIKKVWIFISYSCRQTLTIIASICCVNFRLQNRSCVPYLSATPHASNLVLTLSLLTTQPRGLCERSYIYFDSLLILHLTTALHYTSHYIVSLTSIVHQ
jgi:hypothetical protein